MKTRFEDKVALVTGASSGIGKATALAFAREGARLVLADINENGTRQEAEKLGAEVLFIKTDVSDAKQVEEMIDKAFEKFGRLDCAHNNAGIDGQRKPTTDITEQEWDKVVVTNIKGTWLCMKYELKRMLAAGCGSIVNTASILGLVGMPLQSPYTASKHAIVGMTKSTALEYAKKGIRVNAVCPGPIKTPMLENVVADKPQLNSALLAMQPNGRIGEPDEVANAVLWLSSEEASFVTGQALVVDGGWTSQ